MGIGMIDTEAKAVAAKACGCRPVAAEIEAKQLGAEVDGGDPSLVAGERFLEREGKLAQAANY
jgi:hypothetical protein